MNLTSLIIQQKITWKTKKHKEFKTWGTFACCTKKFRQSHTLLCTMTRHYRSYIQISFPKAIQKALSQKFSKKLHCLGSEWSQPVSVLNCYPILPHELWNKTMFAMSGVRMVIKMIYLLIKETCMSTSPVIGGYLHQMIYLLGYLQMNDLPARLLTNEWSTS